METRLAELLTAFDTFDGIYKKSEIEAAISLREEITPHLLGILEDVAKDPATYVDEDHFGNVYAAVLLGHFKEPAAHLPIIRAFCIPEKERENLWGDMVTATLPALLLQTCNGSFTAIKDLASNREAYDYVRGSALEALTYAVAFGTLSREEVLEFFLGLFSGDEAAEDSDFWGSIVALICDIHPEGAMEVIRRAYDEELVFPGYVGLDEVEKELKRDKDEVLAELRNHAYRSVPADVHDYCSWFSCFREKDEIFSEQDESSWSSPASVLPQAEPKGRKGVKKIPNRNKNKIAKKSRKRNKR